MKKQNLLMASMLAAGSAVSGVWGTALSHKYSKTKPHKDRSKYARKIDFSGRKKPKGSAAQQQRMAKKRKAIRARSGK